MMIHSLPLREGRKAGGPGHPHGGGGGLPTSCPRLWRTGEQWWFILGPGGRGGRQGGEVTPGGGVYLPPVLDCGGLENNDDSFSALEGGEEGRGARSPPGEVSTLRPLLGGDEVSSREPRVFLALLRVDDAVIYRELLSILSVLCCIHNLYCI